MQSEALNQRDRDQMIWNLLGLLDLQEPEDLQPISLIDL